MRRSAFALIVCAGVALGQTTPNVTSLGPKPPRTILWVGNSFFHYHNGLPTFVSKLLDATDPHNDFESRLVTISGSALSWHDLGAYLQPGQMQGFSFSGDNKIVFQEPRPFDAVLLQDCSQCPIHPQLQRTFYETVRKDSMLARKHGAKTILFMTWAYADKPEMTSALAEAYTRAGNDSGALVVPVGLAFAAARTKDPRVTLYEPDNRHPSVAGSYLAACTVVAAVYGQSPVGNGYTAGLEPRTAAFLQSVAADTVAQYFRRVTSDAGQ